MPEFVYEKMGITDSQCVLVIDGPAESVEAIKLPAKVYTNPSSCYAYDHIILFRISQKALETDFPKFKRLLNSTGKLWVAWPKTK